MMPGPNNEEPERSEPAAHDDEHEELAEAAEALAEQQEPKSAAQEQGLVPTGGDVLSAQGLEDSTLEFIQSFNRQLDQIQEVKETLEAEAVELKKEVAARERTIAQQRRRMLELEQEIERGREIERELERLRNTLEARESELEATRSEVRTREATITQKDSFIAELNASHDAMVSKTIELKEEIQGLKEERTRMSAQIETLGSEKEEILNEKRRVEQAMNQLDAKYQAAHDEVMSAKKILGELQSAFETSQRKARAILDKKIPRSPGPPGE
jgi:chromosome segregation ATPase